MTIPTIQNVFKPRKKNAQPQVKQKKLQVLIQAKTQRASIRQKAEKQTRKIRNKDEVAGDLSLRMLTTDHKVNKF